MRRCAITGARSSSVSTACTPGSASAVARIDAADQRVRMRAAHERGMQQPGQRDVVDEAAVAGQQRPILEPGNARSDQSAMHDLDPLNPPCALAALAITSLGVA